MIKGEFQYTPSVSEEYRDLLNLAILRPISLHTKLYHKL